jgi:hypothetical protein
VILCALRSLPPQHSMEVAVLAREMHTHTHGLVLGVDIAGDEVGGYYYYY